MTSFQALHRIKSDELWHHYTGGSLTLYAIDNGILSKIKMGKSMGEAPQVAIKANTWFASLNDKKSYCLLTDTVSPGFDYSDLGAGKGVKLSRCILSTERSLKDILPLFNSRSFNSDRAAYHQTVQQCAL